MNHYTPTEDFGPAQEGLTDEAVAAIILQEREPVRREMAGLRILFVELCATLPRATWRRGRASAAQASALYEALVREGRISCPLDDFLAWLGPSSTGGPAVPAEPLKWLESDERKREKQIALFIVDYAHAVRAIQGTVAGSGKRELPTKAICAAFGITDRQQIGRIGRRARRENKKRDSNKPSKTQ